MIGDERATRTKGQSRARRSVRRQWWVVGGVLALLAGLVVAGWTVRDRFLPVEVGTAAPDLVAADLDGRPVSLAELRGEVVLLNVWATWCPPCREEMPSMQRLAEQLGPEGLRIVAVSIDAASGKRDAGGREGGDVRAFADEYGLTFDIWRDPEGRVQQIYRTTGVPESFVIDRRGMIVKKVIGATEWDSPANVELIRRLLGE
ncbi:MAG TPA: redoxin domain-containing protein [Longimicrobiaceae bacterium]|nr:redoxin domain-containing protein [Longimicrobiaceae bacterium]